MGSASFTASCASRSSTAFDFGIDPKSKLVCFLAPGFEESRPTTKNAKLTIDHGQAPMQVTVRYYAAARQLAGTDCEQLECDGPALSTAEFRAWVERNHPALAPHLARCRFAINGDFATALFKLVDGDEIVLLPPVAGGAPLVTLRDTPLSIDECVKAVTHSGAGAIVVFTGVVRDHAEGGAVVRLDYEAYDDLANREMRRILCKLESEIDGLRLAAVHRTGSLAVGDIAVVVAASAPHREAAFQGCREAIDRIKETVPIWKKEWAPDGTAHWVNFDAI